LAAAVAVALDDDLIGIVREAIEGALSEDGVVEEGDPFFDAAVGCHDGRGAPVAFDDDLVEVTPDPAVGSGGAASRADRTA